MTKRCCHLPPKSQNIQENLAGRGLYLPRFPHQSGLQCNQIPLVTDRFGDLFKVIGQNREVLLTHLGEQIWPYLDQHFWLKKREGQ